MIQYGGATVEEYTEGGYTTGDVDLGFVDSAPDMAVKAEVMKSMGCDRGVRLFEVEGVVVDLGWLAEIFCRNFITVDTEEGPLLLEAPEESLIGRLLMAVYPSPHPDQMKAAELMMAQGLSGHLPMDWEEVIRISRLPGFRVETELRDLAERVTRQVDLPMPELLR